MCPKTRPCPKTPSPRAVGIVENSLAQKCAGARLKKKCFWATALIRNKGIETAGRVALFADLMQNSERLISEIDLSDYRANQHSCLSVCAGFSAGDLAHLPGAVDAAYWHAIGIAVPSDIEICGVARFLQKLRIRDKGEPRN